MDNNKLKNEIATWLTFEPRENLDLSHPSIGRMVGNWKNVIKLKKELIRCSNCIFEHLENKGINVEFSESEGKHINTEICYSLGGKLNRSVGILNKLYGISNKPTFELNDPIMSSEAFSLHDKIISTFYSKTKHVYSLENPTVVISKPKVYFDYFTHNFKIKFKLLDLHYPTKSIQKETPIASSEVYGVVRDAKGFLSLKEKALGIEEELNDEISQNTEENSLEPVETKPKSGLDSVKNLSFDHFEVKNQSRFKADKWCRPIYTMTAELSQPACDEEKPIVQKTQEELINEIIAKAEERSDYL